MEQITNPHDKLFREVWSRKSEAQSFLACYLPEKICQALDLNSLDVCKDSFIAQDLKEYYSDMLYTVDLQGKMSYVYVLFEHKSYADRLIHLQLLEYMLKIWRLHLKQTDERCLPIILPLVIDHGGAGGVMVEVCPTY